MNNTKEVSLDDKPRFCSKCGGEYRLRSIGGYECKNCGNVEMDEFGKVREFLDENGPRSAIEISAATGIPLETINEFLRKGRIEIPDGSSSFIKCEKCGTSIRFGRFCPSCALELTKQIQGALKKLDVGETPKKTKGNMYILDKRR